MNFKEEKIVYKHINELIPYENNPRINKDAVNHVVSSIKNYGFRNPIILDKNNVIIAGHTRLESAKELGIEKVPCIIADDLTEQQAKALRLLDNKTAEFAQWDFDLLRGELEDLELEELGIDWGTCDIDLKESDPGSAPTMQGDINLDEYNSPKKEVQCPACDFKFEVYQ